MVIFSKTSDLSEKICKNYLVSQQTQLNLSDLNLFKNIVFQLKIKKDKNNLVFNTTTALSTIKLFNGMSPYVTTKKKKIDLIMYSKSKINYYWLDIYLFLVIPTIKKMQAQIFIYQNPDNLELHCPDLSVFHNFKKIDNELPLLSGFIVIVKLANSVLQKKKLRLVKNFLPIKF